MPCFSNNPKTHRNFIYYINWINKINTLKKQQLLVFQKLKAQNIDIFAWKITTTIYRLLNYLRINFLLLATIYFDQLIFTALFWNIA